MTLAMFQPPGCLINRVVLFALIRSYKEARVLFPSLPILASACNESSSNWYSRPIAEPWLFSDSVTEYFKPLLAPCVNLNSDDRSDALNFSLVTISPPLVDSFPSDESTLSNPSFISHPFSGNWLL